MSVQARAVRPVSVVAWSQCCPPSAPPADPIAGMSLLVAQGAARVWAGPTREHRCMVNAQDRPFLVTSPLGAPVWFMGSVDALDPFTEAAAAAHVSVAALHAALVDLGPWLAEDGAGVEAATTWAPFGCSAAQAARLDASLMMTWEPTLFGSWLTYAAAVGRDLDWAVDWACQFDTPVGAEPWLQAGFTDPVAAASFAEQGAARPECALDPRCAARLWAGGVDGYRADATRVVIEGRLRPTLHPEDRVMLTPAEQDTRDHAVVLAELVPGLGVEAALLCARAGLVDPEEVAGRIGAGSLDWDAVAALAALRG